MHVSQSFENTSTPSCENKAEASELHCLVTENQKPKSVLLKSSNVDSADSNEVLLWQKHQDMCLVWNLNLGQASHLTSDLGKTNEFVMLMSVSVEDSSTFFACEERSSTRKSPTFVATGSYLRQDPPWFEFLVIFDFFAPWYRKSREASSVKISWTNSKEKLVKCATEFARLHKVSIQSCTQNRPSPKVQSLLGDWI